MLLQRTEKGRAELSAGVRTLSLRDRRLLLEADGSRSVGELSSLIEGEGVATVMRLVQCGYLEPLGRPLRAHGPTTSSP